MKPLTIFSLFSLFLLMSCNENGITSATSNTPTLLVSLSAGSYVVACFENKLASQGFGSTIYSKANMTLNSDGNGLMRI